MKTLCILISIIILSSCAPNYYNHNNLLFLRKGMQYPEYLDKICPYLIADSTIKQSSKATFINYKYDDSSLAASVKIVFKDDSEYRIFSKNMLTNMVIYSERDYNSFGKSRSRLVTESDASLYYVVFKNNVLFFWGFQYEFQRNENKEINELFEIN